MTGTAVDTSLAGCKVLITRPLRQQQSLGRKIRAAGGVPVSLPLLDIVPLTDAAELAAVRHWIQHLEHFDVLLFVSSNAARYGAELIRQHWPRLPTGIDVIAIGKTTARTVTAALACPVTHPSQGADSEAVLALPMLQQVAGKQVGIVRGQGGRELLADTLGQRGAAVHYLEVYRRQAITRSATEIARLLAANGCDIITAHSGESLQILMDQSRDNIRQITLLPLVVPSARVAEQAQQFGFAQVINAHGADDESILQTLRQLVCAATPGNPKHINTGIGQESS